MHINRLIGRVLFATVLSGCGSNMPAAPSTSFPTPSSPIPATVDLAGAWFGGATDSQGSTAVTWTLTQSGTSVSGTARTTALNADDGSCGSCHRNKSGTVTGTLTGASLTLTMFFAAGVDGDPTPACSATLNASSSSISSSAVVAAYSGSDTCQGAFANGTMTMRRQSGVGSQQSTVGSRSLSRWSTSDGRLGAGDRGAPLP